MTRTVEVLRPGPLTTIQDLGRTGYQHLGVPRSGAADRGSLRLANRLVGNHENDACLETTLIGPQLRLPSCTLALTGATVNARLDDRPVAMNTPVHVNAGALLTIGTAYSGLRTYLAFRGGITAPPVLGSRSTDILSKLGPPALNTGQKLTLGHPETPFPHVDQAPVPTLSNKPLVHAIPGPRADMFTTTALTRLYTHEYSVTSNSNRVGVRLNGPPLQRHDNRQLLSEGIVSGAIQVPPDGQPIILLADHPTTGGYPVIAVITTTDLNTIGQLRPGQQITFRAPASARK